MCFWRLRVEIRFVCTQNVQFIRFLGASLVLCDSWSGSVRTLVAQDKLRCAPSAPVFRRHDARVWCQLLRRTAEVVMRTFRLPSCHKALFLLGLPQVLLAWYSWWYLLSRDRCLPSRVGQRVDPTSLLTDLQIGGCRSMAPCCTSAPGCISPKRNQKRALQETFVPILFFSQLIF